MLVTTQSVLCAIIPSRASCLRGLLAFQEGSQ